MSVKRLNKPCERCGTMMHGVTLAKMYCPECLRLIRNQREAARSRRIRQQSKGMPVICEGCGMTFFSKLMNPPKKCPKCREKDAKFTKRSRDRARGESYEKVKALPKKQNRKLMPWEVVGKSNPGRQYGKVVEAALLEQQRQEMEERRKTWPVMKKA